MLYDCTKIKYKNIFLLNGCPPAHFNVAMLLNFSWYPGKKVKINKRKGLIVFSKATRGRRNECPSWRRKLIV